MSSNNITLVIDTKDYSKPFNASIVDKFFNQNYGIGYFINKCKNIETNNIERADNIRFWMMDMLFSVGISAVDGTSVIDYFNINKNQQQMIFENINKVKFVLYCTECSKEYLAKFYSNKTFEINGFKCCLESCKQKQI